MLLLTSIIRRPVLHRAIASQITYRTTARNFHAVASNCAYNVNKYDQFVTNTKTSNIWVQAIDMNKSIIIPIYHATARPYSKDAKSQEKEKLLEESEKGKNKEEDLLNVDDSQLTLFQRFKKNFKKYWYVMLPVHIATSLMWFGGFYYLAKLGVNPVPLLEFLGVPEKYVDPLKKSTVGYVAMAYAFYKVITPLRYIVTIGTTGFTVRFLAERGWIKPMPTSEQFKKMVRDKAQSLKEKSTQPR